MTATLLLRDVARHFGGVPAVDGVSLQVPAGQITGLIGPNGAGKTTVVNLITGILHLTHGQVLLDEPVAGMNDAEAESLAEIFRKVAASGVAVLLIEHNMRFVMSLCSHLYVLAFGRLIAEGPPEVVGRDPRVIEAYLGA